MRIKYLALVSVFIAVFTTAACDSGDAGESSETTVDTTIVTVTDENGQAVRDERGSVITSIITPATTTTTAYDYQSDIDLLNEQISSLREMTIREPDPLKKDDFLGAKGNERISEAVSIRAEIEPYKPDTCFVGGKEYSTDITSLTITGKNLSDEDIKELKYMVKLEELFLYSNNISDLSPLQGLTSLKTLSLFDNDIENLDPLSGLYNLENLFLRSNDITDLTPLSRLANLSNLDISDNNISDLSPLGTCRAMTMLWINDNDIASIAPIYTMTHLARIHMQNNRISDLAPLSEMTYMLEIYADNNAVSDISPLEKMVRLQWLRLNGNPVSNAEVIANFTGIKKVYIENTLISLDQINELRAALPNAEISY
jgi:Leucine-rich repeat (LRR) protein